MFFKNKRKENFKEETFLLIERKNEELNEKINEIREINRLSFLFNTIQADEEIKEEFYRLRRDFYKEIYDNLVDPILHYDGLYKGKSLYLENLKDDIQCLFYHRTSFSKEIYLNMSDYVVESMYKNYRKAGLKWEKKKKILT